MSCFCPTLWVLRIYLTWILRSGGRYHYPLSFLAGLTGLSISYILSYSHFTGGLSEALNAEKKLLKAWKRMSP